MGLDRAYFTYFAWAICYNLCVKKEIKHEQAISMVSKEKEILKGW